MFRLFLVTSFILTVFSGLLSGQGPGSSQEINARIDAVIAKINSKDFAAAIADLDGYIAGEPSQIRYYVLRADAYLSRAETKGGDRKDMAAALADASKAVDLDPGFWRARLLRGTIFARQGENDKAIPDLEIAVKGDPTSIQGNFFLGVAYLNTGDADKALVYLQKVHELSGRDTSPAAFYQRALAYLTKENYDLALKDIEHYLALFPKDLDAIEIRGRTQVGRREYEKALVDLTAVLSGEPDRTLPRYVRSAVLRELGRFPEAIADIEKYISVFPDDPDGYESRSQLKVEIGDYTAAIADLTKAASLNKKYNEVTIDRSYIYLYSNKNELAASEAQAFLELNGLKGRRAVWAVINGYIALRKANKPAEAKKLVDEWFPQLDGSLWTTTLLAHLKGDIPAGTLLAQAGEDTGKLTEAHCYIGVAQLISGETEKAKLHFNWIRENGVRSYTEYTFAISELDRLAKGPAAKYAPMTGTKPALAPTTAKSVPIGTKAPAPKPASKPSDPVVGNGPFPAGAELNTIRFSAIGKCEGGDYATGIAMADRLIKFGAEPDGGSGGYSARGRCKELMKDLAGAVADYSMSIKLGTSSDYTPWVHFMRGSIYFKQGKTALAKADEQKCIDLEGDYCSVEPDPQ